MNDTQTLTLSDFLLARITEDERWLFGSAANSERRSPTWELNQIDDSKSWDLLSIHQERMRAECEAKRQIIELCRVCDECGDRMNQGVVLGFLAAAYVDHPDYRQGWKP